MAKSKKVNVIESNDDTALVEADGERVFIPRAELNDETHEVESETLEAGVVYGDAFPGFEVSFIEKLHACGIWTKADVLYNRPALLNAISEYAVAPLLRRLLEYAKNEEVK